MFKIFDDLYELHEEDGSYRFIRYNRHIKGWQWGIYNDMFTMDTSVFPVVDFNVVTRGYVLYPDKVTIKQ